MSSSDNSEEQQKQLLNEDLRRIATKQKEIEEKQRDCKTQHDNDSDDIDSAVSDTEYDLDTEYDKALLAAQREWEESLDQLYRALQLVILPLVGKYFGRKTARLIWRSVATYLWS